MSGRQELGLRGAALVQQSDLARSLVRMAMAGVPRPDADRAQTAEQLAAHALLTAFLAIAKTTPAITRRAAALAFDASHELTATADGHVPCWPVITA